MTGRFRVACMEGDGIGPEIVPAARRVVDVALDAAGAVPVDWVDLPMGAGALARYGRAVPESSFEVLAGCQGFLVGPHDSESYPPGWRDSGEKVPSAQLRGRYELFANVRPARSRAGVPSPVDGVDLVIVRENTEGLYSDRNMFTGNGEFMPTADVVLTVGLFTRPAIRRIATAAFALARTRRRHVTVVHKANVMPIAFGMFRDECRAVAAGYPDVELDDYLFDAVTAHLVRRPRDFDVIVTENLFGDTLSDLTGELVGALGMSGSLNAGDRYAMAQAAHGSAPDIAGKGVANPVGMLVSAAMLLRWLGDRAPGGNGRVGDGRAGAGDAGAGYRSAGDDIDAAVDAVIAGGTRTRDIGGTAGTREFTDAVVRVLRGTDGRTS